MKRSKILLPLAALAFAPAAIAQEAPEPRSERAYIAFADHGGVRNWRAEDRDTIYFQDRHKQWYKAELASPSSDLPFALAIGIDSGSGGRLDRWSSIVVDGQRHHFLSFEKIDGQPPRRGGKEEVSAQG